MSTWMLCFVGFLVMFCCQTPIRHKSICNQFAMTPHNMLLSGCQLAFFYGRVTPIPPFGLLHPGAQDGLMPKGRMHPRLADGTPTLATFIHTPLTWGGGGDVPPSSTDYIYIDIQLQTYLGMKSSLNLIKAK